MGFFSSVCGLFVVAFLFFRFRFFILTFFSHSHFPTPPFPRKRESPCDARRRRGIRAFGAELGDSRFRGNGEGGGVGFFRVFADSLLSRFCFFASVFSHLHFFLTLPLPHTPHSRESGNLPMIARRRRGICAFGAGLGDSRFRGNGRGSGNEKGGTGMERRGGNGGRGEGRGIGGVEKMWKRCGEWFFGGRKKIKKNCQFGNFFADCV